MAGTFEAIERIFVNSPDTFCRSDYALANWIQGKQSPSTPLRSG